MEMTKHDIRNYLVKIYKIPVINVHTEVRLGEFFRDPVRKYIKKKDDYRVAVVTMVNNGKFPQKSAELMNSFDFQPKDVTFEYPNIYETDKMEQDSTKAEKELDTHEANYKKFLNRNADSRGSPPWFSF